MYVYVCLSTSHQLPLQTGSMPDAGAYLKDLIGGSRCTPALLVGGDHCCQQV